MWNWVVYQTAGLSLAQFEWWMGAKRVVLVLL